MSRENNRWLGWKRITQKYALSMEDKMAAGAFGALGITVETAPFGKNTRKEFFYVLRKVGVLRKFDFPLRLAIDS